MKIPVNEASHFKKIQSVTNSCEKVEGYLIPS